MKTVIWNKKSNLQIKIKKQKIIYGNFNKKKLIKI